MSADLPIVLYHYKFSPYARRIQWYLALRGIPYAECLQPPILPRPDVNDFGIAYRRIPILSIGRDIYLDTRLQLTKLETSEDLASFAPPLSSITSSAGPDATLITSLLEKWAVDAGLFATAASLLPSDLPLTSDPKFAKDRADFLGASGSKISAPSGSSKEEIARVRAQAATIRRAEALNEMKSYFGTIERQLSDGRTWLLGGTAGPSLADLEAVWLPHWLVLGLPPGALSIPGTRDGTPYVTEREFPRTWAWLRRFDALIKEKASRDGTAALKFNITQVKGKTAREMVVRSKWNEDAATVDNSDALVCALGLMQGDEVEVNPTDTGKNHKDRGRLVGLNTTEIVWEARTKENETIRVHAPRHGFEVNVGGTKEKL